MTLRVTVDRNGLVKAVRALGPFATTPAGGCVEEAIKGADFPPSDGSAFDYPVVLR
jgi:hypothetical protein